MPAKDIFHETVKKALLNDGWTITVDPLYIVQIVITNQRIKLIVYNASPREIGYNMWLFHRIFLLISRGEQEVIVEWRE